MAYGYPYSQVLRIFGGGRNDSGRNMISKLGGGEELLGRDCQWESPRLLCKPGYSSVIEALERNNRCFRN